MSSERETKLWDKIGDDLKARSKWEDRLPVWYRMRHTGIPRRSSSSPCCQNSAMTRSAHCM